MTRRGEEHRLRLGVAAEPFTQIDPATGSELRDQFTGRRVERVDVGVLPREEAPTRSVGPVHHTAIGPTAGDARIERPSAHARRRVECDDFMGRRQRIQQAIDDERARLQATLLTGVVRPGDLEIPNI